MNKNKTRQKKKQPKTKQNNMHDWYCRTYLSDSIVSVKGMFYFLSILLDKAF